MELDDLIIFADEHNIDISYLKDCDEIDGIACKYCDQFYIAIKNALKQEYGKHKEVMAHEIAHCILDNFYMVNSKNPMARFNFGKYEREAREFCIKMLLPANELKKAIKNYVYEDGSLWHLQEYLNVSMSFLRDAINYYCQHGVRLPKIPCYA